MLIVCSGPDTFNARQKARELVEAFRAKFDPSGFSVEVMSAPDLQGLLNRLSAPSFFSSKRLIRCDRLLEKMKIQDVRTLLKRLAADKDQTIVVSVEDEPPVTKTLDECKEGPFFHYPYPLLSGTKFLAWCKKRAIELKVSEQTALKIAQECDGDVWLAEQEFIKISANPSAPLIMNEEDPGTIYAATDAYFLQQAGWRSVCERQDSDEFLVTLVSQARTLIRVRDGQSAGIHPYVVKKIIHFRPVHLENSCMKVFTSLVMNRTGLAKTNELTLG